ncbi:hypothetical protein [Pseudomonas sp. N040]|uniref:hypothetical protein n=1 Tax=Pseudomonas sp. N040 TaxID=2785325 RepID=UPI0018A25DD3|nr:hypothetical protein [Pseudomonas sp. N040]MBF7730171.1 hypothetical protein [Pseudomonas sp. N040]MBW7013813.1 hypothetical protein [Pseudomonas sp. N040]
MSLVNRRRAIYTGLARHLPEDELLPMLSYWEAHYAEKPAFALNEFLAEVARRCSQKLERASLYRELLGIMNGPSTALLPDPLVQLQVWRSGAGSVAAEVSGPDAQARQTFVELSSRLFAALPDARQKDLRRLAAGDLSRLNVDAELRLRLRTWLEQGGKLERIVLQLEQLRTLLSLIYGGLCELFGPVQADQLLSRAVREVDELNLPLPPQKLL